MFIRSGYSAQTRSTEPVPADDEVVEVVLATEHHHRGADVLERRRDLERWLRAQSVRLRLRREPLGAQRAELDHVVLARPGAVRGDDLPDPLDPHRARALAHRDGLGEVL